MALSNHATVIQLITVAESRCFTFLFQHALVELVPVVEIVQVNRVRTNRAGIADAIGFQDSFADFVFVDVALNGHVELVNGGFVQVLGVLLHPFLELRIGGLLRGDEASSRGALQPYVHDV